MFETPLNFLKVHLIKLNRKININIFAMKLLATAKIFRILGTKDADLNDSDTLFVWLPYHHNKPKNIKQTRGFTK